MADADGPWARATLFFIFGCATSAAQVALLSMLNIYSQRFGPQIFVALNCATFLPSLPIVLLQSKLDSRYDRIFSTAVAFKFRIAVSFLVLISALCALPIIPLEERELLTCATIIGVFTGVLFGSFYQLLTFVHPEHQTTNTAYFAFGYQGSGLVVLCLSLAAFGGLEHAATPEMMRHFFFSVAAVTLLALVLFLALTFSESFRESARLRDMFDSGAAETESQALLGPDRSGPSPSHLSAHIPQAASHSDWGPEQVGRGQALLRSVGGEHVGALSREQAGDTQWEESQETERGGAAGMTTRQVLERSFPCAACIFVTIFASTVVFPFYTFVPSASPVLPTVLFYTKIFSDTLARPMTTALTCTPAPLHLLAVAGARLVICVPAFFLYITWVPPGAAVLSMDIWFCAGIAVFSFLSGYLVCVCVCVCARARHTCMHGCLSIMHVNVSASVLYVHTQRHDTK